MTLAWQAVFDSRRGIKRVRVVLRQFNTVRQSLVKLFILNTNRSPFGIKGINPIGAFHHDRFGTHQRTDVGTFRYQLHPAIGKTVVRITSREVVAIVNVAAIARSYLRLSN